jgi:hypothetical protein
MLKLWTAYNSRIGSHFLSALINADQSGLTDKEARDFSAWEADARAVARRAGYTVGHWDADTDNAQEFARCDISHEMGNVCPVALHVYKEGADAWAEIVAPFCPDHYPMPEGFTMPEGFEGTSWGNDACPSVTSQPREGYAVRVWIDAADPEKRECDGGGRLVVSFLSEDGGSLSHESPVISDAWADVTRFLADWDRAPSFDRFDICEAYAQLEADYNMGGLLQERPSNQRRRESCGVQLARMQYKRSPLSRDLASMSDNARAIYWQAVRRLHLLGE